jgi:hypothetical protein
MMQNGPEKSVILKERRKLCQESFPGGGNASKELRHFPA